MITHAFLTKAGNRKNNEDAIGIFKNQYGQICCVLCDGLGGCGNGKVAANQVVDEVKKQFENNLLSKHFIDQVLLNSQEKLLVQQRKENSDMKTTIVLVTIDKTEINWTHIGDSRFYYFKDGIFQMHTLDHSITQILVTLNEITESQIRHHPDRNKLVYVLGEKWDYIPYKIQKRQRSHKQAILLCSDGFWELIEERKMEECLKHADDVKDWLTKMENIIINKGKNQEMDNYSAIGIWIE